MHIEFTLTDDKGQTFIGSTDLRRMAASIPLKEARKTAREKSKKLPDYILELRDAGFFKEPRTGNEVHAALLDKYHCQSDRVQMALLRMQRRKHLRKTNKVMEGREQVAYAW